MTAEDGDDPVADRLGGRGAGLGELAGDASDLDHRLAGAMSQDHRHLQEDAKEVTDVIGAMLGIDATTALALATARRLRDVVIFFPGLIAWQWAETRIRNAKYTSASG